MRWPFFAIMTYLLLGLDIGLRNLLAMDNRAAPSLVLVLAAFIALLAAPLPALAAALILGLCVDLTRHLPLDATLDVVVPGPMALGYLLGAFVVLQLRALVRRSVLGLAVMVLVAGLFVHLVAVALLTARGLPWLLGQPIPGWSAPAQLLHAFFEVLYSSLVALPVGFLLGRVQKWFAFDLGKAGFSGYVIR